MAASGLMYHINCGILTIPSSSTRTQCLLPRQRRPATLIHRCGSSAFIVHAARKNNDNAGPSYEPDVEMLELPAPSSSNRDGKKDTDGDQRKLPGLLQRIALSFMSALAALIPSRLKQSWKSILNVRAIRIGLFFLVGSTLSFATRSVGSGQVAPVQEVMYSDFLSLVNTGNVRAARFEDGTRRILFDLKPHSSQIAAQAAAEAKLASKRNNPEEVAVMKRSRAKVPRQFYTRHIPDPQLIATLSAAGVEFGAVKASAMSGVVRVFATALALWIPLIPLFIIMKRVIDGKSGGSNKKRKANTKFEQQRITFADVAGVGAAKEELQEVVACLKDARRYAKVGAKLPSGVLLCGPPGTGKTLLAKAVAGEAGVPFLAASASEFVELFVGRGAARVRELFTEARKMAPCVVFIDELDAVGGKRGAGLNEERDQTLNQLLTELDGFEGRPGVMLLAATNRPEVLDSALMRPGRLSRKVNVPLPDELARSAILNVHMRKIPMLGGTEGRQLAADQIARLTAGCNGAELANVVNEAAFLTARREGDVIELPDLIEAVQRTRYGVNGGDGIGGGFIKTLRGMLIDLASTGAPKTQPLGS